MTAIAVFAFLLLTAVVSLTTRAFLRPPPAPVAPDDVSEMDAQREKLLEAIRELDMDMETGKLSDEDHRALRARAVAKAAGVMRSLDEVKLAQAPAEAPAPVAPAASVTVPVSDVEREIAARKEALAMRACPRCGSRRAASDTFCGACGAPLSSREAS